MNPRVFARSPYDREILRLGGPALGALAAQPLYVLVDTAIVGHLGTGPLGGLGVASTVLATALWVFNFLAYGTTAAVARAMGAGARRDAVRDGVSAMWLAAGIGAVLAVLGVGFAGPAARLIGARGEVLEAATTYLRISALGAPSVLIALAGMGFLRGVKDTRTPLVVALAANAFNVVAEVWFVFGMHWGVAGSAWATLIAEAGAAVAFASIVLRSARAAAEPLTPRASSIRASLRVGMHLIVRTGSLLIAFAVATSVAARISSVAVASHQVAFQVWMFLALVMDAIAIAGQAMIATMLGSGDRAGATSAARRMMEWSLVAGLAFAAAIAALSPALAPLFSGDAAVRSSVRNVLLIVAAMQPLNGIVFVLDGVLIGAGDTPFLAVAMAVATSVVLIPGALVVLALDGTLVWLWLVIAAFMGARLAAVLFRFRTGQWARTGLGT